MNIIIKIIVLLLLIVNTTNSKEREITVKLLVDNYEYEVLTLLKNKMEMPYNIFQEEAIKIAKKIFKNHHKLLRNRAVELINSLPKYPEKNLKYYKLKHQSNKLTEEFEKSSKGKDLFLMIKGWNPKVTTIIAKNYFISRKVSTREFANRHYYKMIIQDKFYLLKNNTVLLESMGDIFVIKLELDESGVFLPHSIKWYIKK